MSINQCIDHIKHSLLLVSLIASCITYQTKAQNYIPLQPDTSCYWITSFYHYDGLSGSSFTCSAEVITYVKKDTIINSLLYHQLNTYTSAIYGMTNLTCNMMFPNNYPTAYIREDTANQKIYRLLYYNSLTPNEIEIDFTNIAVDSIEMFANTMNPVIDSDAYEKL